MATKIFFFKILPLCMFIIQERFVLKRVSHNFTYMSLMLLHSTKAFSCMSSISLFDMSKFCKLPSPLKTLSSTLDKLLWLSRRSCSIPRSINGVGLSPNEVILFQERSITLKLLQPFKFGTTRISLLFSSLQKLYMVLD